MNSIFMLLRIQSGTTSHFKSLGFFLVVVWYVVEYLPLFVCVSLFTNSISNIIIIIIIIIIIVIIIILSLLLNYL